MRVLQVVSGTFFGGGQKVALDLKRVLDTTDQSVSICALGVNTNQLVATASYCLENYGGEYNRPWVLLKAGFEFGKVLDASRPNIVHSHGWDAAFIAALALRSRPFIKHLIHWHTTDWWLTSKSWKRRIRRRLTKMFLAPPRVKVVAVSHAVQEHLYLTLGYKQVDVVLNGVDTTNFTPAIVTDRGGQAITIGTAGRLSPTKGIDVLLRAVASVRRDAPLFEVLIAGEGSEEAALEELAEELELSGQVRFVGFVHDMVHFYQRLDIFALTSRSEGLPLVVLEAMACGLPVIAADVGGTREVVRQGVNGYVVPPDDVHALADKLKELLSSAQKRRELGRNAREGIVDSFSLETWASKMRSLYRELV